MTFHCSTLLAPFRLRFGTKHREKAFSTMALLLRNQLCLTISPCKRRCLYKVLLLEAQHFDISIYPNVVKGMRLFHSRRKVRSTCWQMAVIRQDMGNSLHWQGSVFVVQEAVKLCTSGRLQFLRNCKRTLACTSSASQTDANLRPPSWHLSKQHVSTPIRMVCETYFQGPWSSEGSQQHENRYLSRTSSTVSGTHSFAKAAGRFFLRPFGASSAGFSMAWPVALIKQAVFARKAAQNQLKHSA